MHDQFAARQRGQGRLHLGTHPGRPASPPGRGTTEGTRTRQHRSGGSAASCPRRTHRPAHRGCDLSVVRAAWSWATSRPRVPGRRSRYAGTAPAMPPVGVRKPPAGNRSGPDRLTGLDPDAGHHGQTGVARCGRCLDAHTGADQTAQHDSVAQHASLHRCGEHGARRCGRARDQLLRGPDEPRGRQGGAGEQQASSLRVGAVIWRSVGSPSPGTSFTIWPPSSGWRTWATTSRRPSELLVILVLRVFDPAEPHAPAMPTLRSARRITAML